MPWPWTQREKRGRYHRVSIAEREAKFKIKERELAHNQLIQMLADADDDERRELVGQVLGLKLKTKAPRDLRERILEEALADDEEYKDAVVKAEVAEVRSKSSATDLRSLVQQRVSAKIQEDPELVDRLAGREIEKLESEEEVSGPLADMLEYEEARERLQKRLGGKGSGLLESIMSKDTVTEVVGLIRDLVAGSKRERYIVESDGQIKELTSQQFQEYLALREPRKKGLTEPEKAPEKPEGQAFIKLDGIQITREDIVELFSHVGTTSPAEFIEILNLRAAKGEQKVQLLINLLPALTLEAIYDRMEKLGDEWIPYKEMLLVPENKKWLEEVLGRAKGVWTTE